MGDEQELMQTYLKSRVTFRPGGIDFPSAALTLVIACFSFLNSSIPNFSILFVDLQ